MNKTIFLLVKFSIQFTFKFFKLSFGLVFNSFDFTAFIFSELFFERGYLDINLLFNFITNLLFLILFVFIPLLTLSLDFFFILLYEFFLLKSEITFNFHNAIFIILLIDLSLFPDLLLSFSSDERILSLVGTNWSNRHFHLLLLCLLIWLSTTHADIHLLRHLICWYIWCSFFLSLELQELLSILFIKRMIIHFLLGYRVYIKDLIIFVEVCLPWFWYRCLQPFFSNE